MNLNINLAPKMAELFQGRYFIRCAYGGRGSTKTRGFVQMCLSKAIFYAACGVSGSILCGRQFQVSIQKSTLAELKAELGERPDMAQYFDIGEKYLRTKGLAGTVEFDFVGLDKNLESLKGKTRILVCFLDEAETISEEAFRMLLPTLRATGRFPDGTQWHSECWIAWNPRSEESAVYKRFIAKTPKNAKVVKVNYTDNPWWNENIGLRMARKADEETLDPATYKWIWEGEILRNSSSQVLSGKVRIHDFEPDYDRWDCYQGVDWGFSQDPTTAIKAWVDPQHPEYLYVSHEAGGIGVDLDDTAGVIFEEIPHFVDTVTFADSARPESISIVNKHLDKPCLKSVRKTQIEDGIAFLRSFAEIRVHPRCQELIRESVLYSYKTRADGEITSTIIDRYNHYIDALRYAVSELQRSRAGGTGTGAVIRQSTVNRPRRGNRRR